MERQQKALMEAHSLFLLFSVGPVGMTPSMGDNACVCRPRRQTTHVSGGGGVSSDDLRDSGNHASKATSGLCVKPHAFGS